MSFKISGQVWDLELKANELLVLLALADHADHEGNNIFPSQNLIAWKTGYSTKTVSRICKQLVKSKILKETKRPGKTTLFSIDISAGKQKQQRNTLDKMSDVEHEKRTTTPDKMSEHPGQNVRTTPDKMSDEPIIEPVNESNKDNKLSVVVDKQRNKDIGEIIKIHVDTGIIDRKPGASYNNKTKRTWAEAILDDGIMPDDVLAYVRHLKQQPFWSDKSISLEYIAKNIKAYCKHQAKQPPAQPDKPVEINFDLTKTIDLSGKVNHAD